MWRSTRGQDVIAQVRMNEHMEKFAGQNHLQAPMFCYGRLICPLLFNSQDAYMVQLGCLGLPWLPSQHGLSGCSLCARLWHHPGAGTDTHSLFSRHCPGSLQFLRHSSSGGSHHAISSRIGSQQRHTTTLLPLPLPDDHYVNVVPMAFRFSP